MSKMGLSCIKKGYTKICDELSLKNQTQSSKFRWSPQIEVVPGNRVWRQNVEKNSKHLKHAYGTLKDSPGPPRLNK